MKIDQRKQELWITAMVLSLMTYGSLAYADVTQTTSVTDRVNSLKQQLSLSDAQTSQIQTILQNLASAKTTPPTSAQDRQAYYDNLRQQRQQAQSQMQSVLTPDQVQIFQQLHQNHGQDQGNRTSGWNGDKHDKRWNGQKGQHHGRRHHQDEQNEQGGSEKDLL